MIGVRTNEQAGARALDVAVITSSLRRNPVTVAGMVTGASASLVGATAAGVLAGAPGSGTRLLPGRTLAALVVAAGAGALAGRITQRWTWSDDRVTDELLDAELLLWDGHADGQHPDGRGEV